MILITGGAGYIGSHMAKYLARAGLDVVIFDNLSTGHRELARHGAFFEGDINCPENLSRCFAQYPIKAVMHFAASSLVGESVAEPFKYYRNNVAGTLNLLEQMRQAGVKQLIFSSTAAIYGNPKQIPIPESHAEAPLNPYGRSKWMMERLIRDAVESHGFDAIALRYFNAAGADPEGELGEWHEPETHLIPLILKAALGKRPAIVIYGDDYDTPDGTCIRDYIHVWDLAAAHAQALTALLDRRLTGFHVFNLGIGQGYSVRETIDTARKIVAREGFAIPVEAGARRPGDPAVLVADPSRAQTALAWTPRFPALSTMIEHAWRWEKRLARLERSESEQT